MRGFTLIELLVAVIAASILSLSALQMYSACHRLSLQLVRGYQRESSSLLQQMRGAMPYDTNMYHGPAVVVQRKKPTP